MATEHEPAVQKNYFIFSFIVVYLTITPDVFVHAFAHHEDDVDFYSANSSFSHQHTHCDHLLDEMPASQLADALHLPAVPVSGCILKIETPETVQFIFAEVISLRGPPSLV